MKKLLSLMMSLVLLGGALSMTAFATDAIETADFTITNATYVDEGNGGYYQAEEFCTVTTNRDLFWVNMYYYDYTTSGWKMITPLSVDSNGKTYIDADASICMGTTGAVMDYYDWAEAFDGDYDNEPYFMAGATLTIYSEIYVMLEAIDTAGASKGYHFEVHDAEAEVPVAVAEVVPTAAPTAATVYVDGEEVAFDAYTINDNNYFKLRDVATVVSDSEKQFEVDWSEENNAISLTSGAAYTEVGGELTVGDGTAKEYAATAASLYIDGELVELTAYQIEGNNYYMLRDLGQAFDFDVSWDGEAQAIAIDTTASYTAD